MYVCEDVMYVVYSMYVCSSMYVCILRWDCHVVSSRNDKKRPCNNKYILVKNEVILFNRINVTQ